MKERPVLFRGIPMRAYQVRAILEGRMTQTRRIVRPKQIAYMDEYQGFREMDNAEVCPYGQIGDRLWVRETWATDSSLNDKAPSQFSKWPVVYTADGTVNGCGGLHGDTCGKVRPSIFMPRWASRITLGITGVRVERLQEISEEDAEAEGCTGDHRASRDLDAAQEFRSLWDSINGKRASWESNPWVWVVEFKRLQDETI